MVQQGPVTSNMFQSTYLYKVRQKQRKDGTFAVKFQSTYLYKVRRRERFFLTPSCCFNPRTYIRYDRCFSRSCFRNIAFQSTYLYKVRHLFCYLFILNNKFQSTYLYKVRRSAKVLPFFQVSFNPRTYIRYDPVPMYRSGT